MICPIASGALFTKIVQGFGELRRLVSSRATPRLYGGQAEGCAPVATAFADGGARTHRCGRRRFARSLAIGNPADGDFAVGAARETGGAIHAVAEDDIVENMGLLEETTGVFGETAPGVTLGALRQAVATGALGESDRVVLLVTGDGLKTPEHVADRYRPIEIEPNADRVLERLAAA